MATDKQLRANRANSKKSTGPRTPEGKAASRHNATRHNITGMMLLRTGPEQDAFNAYFQRLLPTFDIHNDLEFELATRAIDTLFRMARISVLEANILATGAATDQGDQGDQAPGEAATPTQDPLDSEIADAVAQAKTFVRESRTFSNLSLYEHRLSRTLRADLDTLRQLRNPKQGSSITPKPHYTGIRWVSDDDPIGYNPDAPKPDTRPGAVRDRQPHSGFVFSAPATAHRPPGQAA